MDKHNWPSGENVAEIELRYFKQANEKITAHCILSDAAHIARFFDLLNPIPLEGDEMKRFGESVSYIQSRILYKDGTSANVEVWDGMVKTPTTGFNSSEGAGAIEKPFVDFLMANVNGSSSGS